MQRVRRPAHQARAVPGPDLACASWTTPNASAAGALCTAGRLPGAQARRDCEHQQRAAGEGQDPVNARRVTNLGTFRAYVEAYLRAHPRHPSRSMTLLVRQLQPGPPGLPLELYCFTTHHGLDASTRASRRISSITCRHPAGVRAARVPGLQRRDVDGRAAAPGRRRSKLLCPRRRAGGDGDLPAGKKNERQSHSQPLRER